MISIPSLVALAICAIACRILYRRNFHPLAHIPGLFLASFSRLWLLYHTLRGEQHISHLAVHARYGPVVRVGPNHILLSDPDRGPWYYSLDKSDWWYCFRPNDHDLAFSTELGIKQHNVKKKRVAGSYSMTALLANEGAMDNRITEFIVRMDEIAAAKSKTDMGSWMNYLNFDILMDMVFSAPPGFIKQGKDVKALIAANQTFVKMAQFIGIYPILYRILQLPFISAFGPKSTDKEGAGLLFGIAERSVASRLQTDGKGEKQKDMLQSLVSHRDINDQPIPPADLKNEAIVAMASGADTTSCILRAAILYVTSNPRVHSTLLAEIDGADTAGKLSSPVRYNEVRGFTYLHAVIQELIRIHPPMASPFWRAAPKGGVVIDGFFIPEGTHVGINEWVIARNKALYGEDVEVFRPERWIEVDAETKRMREKLDVFFGYGDYMCLGRNFAMMQLYKVIVEVFRRFEVVVANPERPWRSRATISFTHEEFYCVVRRRSSAFGAEAGKNG
ncbi:hypothetical protein BT93_L4496 [Corymbia citriodora subsp. variegata]|uniref:Cytochrome P450 n=1 Tax=Corymbia citriodora subsp. variegata TaxID=360336 RepID=A0A8T0CKS2_CORYI|nr:hypothetical protein BT93_L4496 [Corymbia citriodora subsp. variegata]